MKNIIKDLRNNKYTLVAIVIFFLVIIIGSMLFHAISSDDKAKYGDRLDGIEKVKISDERLKDINKKLEEEKIVKEAKSHITGTRINFIIALEVDTNLEEAKKLTDIIIKEFDEKEVAFYDFEVFASYEKEDKKITLEAYKNNSEQTFSYTTNS